MLPLFHRLTLQKYKKQRSPPNFWDILRENVMKGRDITELSLSL
jgi:hypothetical protein